MIRILLVDDQHLVQQGIKSLLDQDLELNVIATVDDGRSAVKEIEYLRPDIVLLDIEMPGMNGITTTKYITRLSPRTKVIILSSHEDRKYVTQALMAGAKGYILKNSLMSDLKQAIVAVNNGYSQIDSKLLAKVFDPSNLKSKRRQSHENKVKNKATETKESQTTLPKSNSRLENAQSAVQNPDLLDLEFQELDANSTPSKKYQLGTSSVNLDEPDKPQTQSPAKPSPSKIIKSEMAQPNISERDTFIQDPEYNELSEPRNIDSDRSNVISSNQKSSSNLADGITDFSSLEKILPEVKSNSSSELAEQSRSFYAQSSAVDLSLDVPVKEPSSFPGQAKKYQGTKTISRAITPQNRKNVSQVYSDSLIPYRPVGKPKKFKSTLKKLREKSLASSWFWNAVLMVFGAILVIIIGSL